MGIRDSVSQAIRTVFAPARAILRISHATPKRTLSTYLGCFQIVRFGCCLALFSLYLDNILSRFPSSGWVMVLPPILIAIATVSCCYTCCDGITFGRLGKRNQGNYWILVLLDLFCLLPMILAIIILLGINGLPTNCRKYAVWDTQHYLAGDRRSTDIVNCGAYNAQIPSSTDTLRSYGEDVCGSSQSSRWTAEFLDYCRKAQASFGVCLVIIVTIYFTMAVASTIAETGRIAPEVVALREMAGPTLPTIESNVALEPSDRRS